MTATVLTTTTIRTSRREPLQVVDMAAASQGRPASSSVRANGEKLGGKRTSSRLNTKENGDDEGVSSTPRKLAQERTMRNATKRNAAAYDEDIGGFQFSRATTKKLKSGLEGPNLNNSAIEKPVLHSPRRGRPPKNLAARPASEAQLEDTRPNTRNGKAPKGRPTRASLEAQDQVGSSRKRGREPSVQTEKQTKQGRPTKAKPAMGMDFQSPEPSQSATSKIALPLADTPVIRRNKEMRENRAGKGQRRSSLGMRGRRASSLIESGASNALPHKEVPTAEFYKHIASEGLSEPRRMKQLLTWCATRAMDAKPSGSRSDDDSARLAARVIQEELLQDFANKSELSDWFSREEVPAPAVIVKKPNPKNLQNNEKIKELEEQIRRLQNERHSLNALLRPPSISALESTAPVQSAGNLAISLPFSNIDETILDASQQSILTSLTRGARPKHHQMAQHEPEMTNTTSIAQQPLPPTTISRRLSRITSSLAPTLDAFASGLHDIDIYRSAADSLSHQILKVCAERLEERDSQSIQSIQELDERPADDGGGTHNEKKNIHHKMALRTRQARQQKEDLSLILGALSRVERR